MPEISFTKVQSVGNDFVLVRLEDVPAEQLPALAIATAPRRTSIGNDGLLAVGKNGDCLILRMFNTDGTEDFCGNGIRCAALYAFQEGWIGRKATVCHHGHTVRVQIGEGGQVSSHFDPPDYSPSAVPTTMDHELFFEEVEVLGEKIVMSSISTGSTHTVILKDHLPEDEEFFKLGPAIENLEIFPERTSVIWARSERPWADNSPSPAPWEGRGLGGGGALGQISLDLESPDSPGLNTEGSGHPQDSGYPLSPIPYPLRIRIWERGVGETLGCGTGSAAAAAVYVRAIHEGKILAGSKPSQICVINPGGPVLISMNAQNAPIISSAVAELLYSGKAKF